MTKRDAVGAKKTRATWSATLLKRPAEGDYFYGVRFPTVDGERGKHITPRIDPTGIGKVLNELMRLGATFDDPKAARQFLQTVLEDADDRGTGGSLVTRPGWHGARFVHASSKITVTSTSKGRTAIWLKPPQAATYLGASKGDLDGWTAGVAEPVRASTLGMFAIGAALAAPLARHAGWPEGAIFNIAGPSSTGKTTVAKVAASVSGDPEKVPDWNVTGTGVEELAAAHSDHLMILDDTERTDGGLARRVKGLTHILVGGQSKKRSAVVSDSHPQSDWFLVMLMTSPTRVAELVAAEGLDHTLGEKVRLIDLPVPTGPNGVFDRLAGDMTAAQQADVLQRGIQHDYGVLMKAWAKKVPELLKEVAPPLEAMLAKMETKLGRPFAGHERRVVRKLLLPLWAAHMASKAGLLPWGKADLVAIKASAIDPAIEHFLQSQAAGMQMWGEFADRLRRRDGVFDLRGGQRLARPIRIEPASEADIGVLDLSSEGVELVGITLAWVKQLNTSSGNPIVGHARKARGLPYATPVKLATQRRLKLDGGGQDRPRLIYLPVAVIEALIRDHAGKGFEDWRLDD